MRERGTLTADQGFIYGQFLEMLVLNAEWGSEYSIPEKFKFMRFAVLSLMLDAIYNAREV